MTTKSMVTGSFANILATVFLSACGGNNDSAIAGATLTSPATVEVLPEEHTSATINEVVGEVTGSAITVEFGGETIEGFNWIRCIGQYAMADGKYKGRLLRIALSATTSDSPMGIKLNIDARQEVWVLNDGRIDFNSDARTYTASGTLKGRAGIAEPTADEVGKVLPLEGDDIRPFRITIQCP